MFLFLEPHLKLLTYYISPNTTDEVDQSNPQPADGSLNLDSDV